MDPEGVHVNFARDSFARDPVLFLLQWTLNKLLRFLSFFFHYLTKKSGSRAQSETRKLHAVFLLIAEQRR